MLVAAGTTQVLLLRMSGAAVPAFLAWTAAVLFLADPSTRILRWAIGFIGRPLALARHKRFETDPDFAEYFLIGTLASVLMAIVFAEGLRALGLARS
jgi:hypothetical protein